MARARRRATYAEYLELEAGSDVRHEYVAGEVIATAGGSVEQGRLISRLGALLARALDGRPCVYVDGLGPIVTGSPPPPA